MVIFVVKLYNVVFCFGVVDCNGNFYIGMSIEEVFMDEQWIMNVFFQCVQCFGGVGDVIFFYKYYEDGEFVEGNVIGD